LPVRSFKLWARIAGVLAGAGLLVWLVIERPLPAQSTAPAPVEDTGVFTTAHSSASAAVREFFGIRSTPAQPIQFTHQVHLANGLQCVFCHTGVDTGPDANIPGTSFCMTCHIAIATDKPEIKKIADFQAKGQDIPWVRVYGFEPEAHVKFNHAPHIRAGVDCATCHGDMTKQTTAQRAVNHTMGFCISCHTTKNVSIDCVTCHF
jgi:hypothetical protein